VFLVRIVVVELVVITDYGNACSTAT